MYCNNYISRIFSDSATHTQRLFCEPLNFVIILRILFSFHNIKIVNKCVYFVKKAYIHYLCIVYLLIIHCRVHIIIVLRDFCVYIFYLNNLLSSVCAFSSAIFLGVVFLVYSQHPYILVCVWWWDILPADREIHLIICFMTCIVAIKQNIKNTTQHATIKTYTKL